LVKMQSRGGFLGCVAVALYLLVCFDGMSPMKRWGAVAVPVLLLVALGNGGYFERMQTLLNPSADYNWSGNSETGRMEVWKRGIGYMLDHPFLGVGAQAFGIAEGTLAPEAARLEEYGKGFKWSTAHNAFVEVGAEIGVFGLLLSDPGAGAAWAAARRGAAGACPDRVAGGLRRDGVLPVAGVLRLLLYAPRDDVGARASARRGAGSSPRDAPLVPAPRRQRVMTVRRAVKSLLESGLVHGGLAKLGRLRRREHTLVLTYHNIVPERSPPFGDRSLHLPRPLFVRQLEQLLRTHAVVPLEDVLAPARPSHRPRIAITFDDAYRGATVMGVEELTKRGLPATLFVVPAFVGGGPFWWDAVARPDGEGVDRGLRDHALRALAGKDGQVREWAAAHRLRLAAVPEWALVASEQELHAATRHPGITLASHTWTHPNLVQLPPAELEDELRRPLAWLRQRFERVIPWLSYPYGLASRAVEAAAAAAGYTAALVLEGGWCAPGRVRRYAVPRHGVPRDLSVNGFVLCTSGLCRHDA
ncbi:MAG: hypothetical protein DMD65_06865, partial [Gemmatimonadetes bacterium]